MAHKKGVGSSKNGRDSNAQRLGVKRFGGEKVSARHDYRAAARYAHSSGRQRQEGRG